MQSFHQGALQGVRSCKEELANVGHVLKHIEAETCDVREWQIGHDSVMWSDRIRALTLRVISHNVCVPSKIVVTEHAAFRITRSTAGVD